MSTKNSNDPIDGDALSSLINDKNEEKVFFQHLRHHSDRKHLIFVFRLISEAFLSENLKKR